MESEKQFYQRLESKGVSRRDFMKYCSLLTATMGLSATYVPKVAEVFAAPKQRPPVIWMPTDSMRSSPAPDRAPCSVRMSGLLTTTAQRG